MSGQGAEAVLYDIDGDAMAVENGTAIPPLTSSLISAGSDGSIARFIRVTSDGYQLIVGVGSPGVPSGGVITIQGDPAGEPIPISGNITASNASVSANDGAIPGFSTLIGGSDGTNLRSARIFDLDSGGGTQWVLGVGLRKASGGGSVEFGTSSDPIRVDTTGTTTQPISGTVTANQGGSWTVSGTGDFTVVQSNPANLRAQLASETTIGTAITSTAVQVGGSDGVNLRPFFTDSSGRQIVIGAAANGAAVAGNPVLVAGSDGTNARSIRTATDGTVRVDPTGTTVQPISISGVNIDAGNSSTTPLGGGASFIGTGFDTSAYSTIGISVFSDKAGTLNLQFSSDNTNWDENIAYTVPASDHVRVTTGPQSRYFRINYVNGGVAQTVFRLQVIEKPVGSYPSTVPVDTVISASDDAIITKSVITGKTTGGGGGYVDVKVNPSGTLTVDASGSTVTANQGTSPWVVNQTQINGSAVTVLAAGEQKVAVEGLAADGAAPSGNPVLTAGSDGTNVQTFTTDPLGNQYVVNYGAPSNALRGISFGRVTGAANTLQAVRSTTYTQQSTNAQRSVSSANANDTSAGTGARQIQITYYTATMTGPFTETVIMNGTTPVNTSNTNICFIEKMEVVSVGSNGSNVGVVSLFVSTGGGGGTIGTIGTANIVTGRGDNQTLWAHHYIASGVTINLTSYMIGTPGNQSSAGFLMSLDPTVTTSPEKIITDQIAISASTQSVVRNFDIPIRIAGPSRVSLYITPAGSNTSFYGGFNFWEL